VDREADREAEPVSGGVRVIAPAKINWTLEVLRKRPDGYHELRSVLQTIDLHDTVTLLDAPETSVEVTGPEAGALPDAPPESNLAYRAALALTRRSGAGRGVRITLEKHVPVAAGLGGGSSDAAAVLRGLNKMWGLGESRENLAELAGEVGSDPPFFVYGGTALIAGRGEHVEPLPDAVAPPILLATPPQDERGEKTAAMFAALPSDAYTAGDVTLGVRDAVVAGRGIVDDELQNVFERVTGNMQPQTEIAMAALRVQGYLPHLCGAGPSFFVLLPGEGGGAALSERIRELGFEPRAVRAMTRRSATAVRSL
jgi:4-diphosphocytidyl-2-C-methyl-D-erythritol kinase